MTSHRGFILALHPAGAPLTPRYAVRSGAIERPEPRSIAARAARCESSKMNFSRRALR